MPSLTTAQRSTGQADALGRGSTLLQKLAGKSDWPLTLRERHGQPQRLASDILVAGADAGISQNVAQALSPKRTFRGRKAQRCNLLPKPVHTLCLFIRLRP
jgi:hypothetical protein